MVDRPDTPGGPCLECRHVFCMVERATAARRCVKCHVTIGYARGYEQAGASIRHDRCDPAAPAKPLYMTKKGTGVRSRKKNIARAEDSSVGYVPHEDDPSRETRGERT